MRHLTDAEIARKRQLGLCFKCDEKFGPNHKCKNKQLSVIILSEMEGTEEGVDAGEQTEEGEGLVELARNEDMLSLLMNSIVGLTEGKTMKLMGKIRGEEVLVLINSGPSHKFISNQVVSKLKLPIINKRFMIIVGNGYRVQSKEICQGVELELQGAHIKQNFYSFDLSGEDLVLGI